MSAGTGAVAAGNEVVVRRLAPLTRRCNCSNSFGEMPTRTQWQSRCGLRSFKIDGVPLLDEVSRLRHAADMKPTSRRQFSLTLASATAGLAISNAAAAEATALGTRKFLYVAVPGVRDYLEYGGHGILVFDIEAGHRFVKRIPSAGVTEQGKPINVKGVCACAATRRLYVSTLKTLMAFDLVSEKLLWEKPYEGGCDRMAIAPDGKFIYLPSLEKDHWHIVDAEGVVLTKVVPKSGAHNTVVGLDGAHAYLAGLKSPLLRVTDTRTHTVMREVGPFTNVIRPFTVNGKQTLCYVNVNELLGFEIGDLKTGKMLHRVEVQDFKKGPVKRHGCPSHGVGLTPDEKEVWVVDAFASKHAIPVSMPNFFASRLAAMTMPSPRRPPPTHTG